MKNNHTWRDYGSQGWTSNRWTDGVTLAGLLAVLTGVGVGIGAMVVTTTRKLYRRR